MSIDWSVLGAAPHCANCGASSKVAPEMVEEALHTFLRGLGWQEDHLQSEKSWQSGSYQAQRGAMREALEAVLFKELA